MTESERKRKREKRKRLKRTYMNALSTFQALQENKISLISRPFSEK